MLPALSAHAVHVGTVHHRPADLPSMARALLTSSTDRWCWWALEGRALALHAHREAAQRVALALLRSRADTYELFWLRGAAIVGFSKAAPRRTARECDVRAHPAHADDRERVDDYVSQILRIGAAQLIAQNRAVMARADMRPWLADIRCPLLVACGDGDLLTPLEHSREIAQLVPHARLEVVPDAGHLMTWEQPQRVNALLLQWLASLQPVASKRT